jgi:serine/threonine-protein kinase
MSIKSARVVGGRYQLHAMLGRGSTATVWAGIDTRLDRPVAIKVLDDVADPAIVQQIDREARTVAQLAHPNIVGVFDVGTDAGTPFLVMELVEGSDLQRLLAREPLDAAEAVRIGMEICSALEAAHAAGVIHGDIKPANILLTASHSVKVCDFGIARMQQPTRPSQLRSAAAVGTIEYMAPEQATGGQADHRTDLYALGCVLYAMLTGGPPFSDRDPVGVLWQQVHQQPAPLALRRSDTPRDLETIVNRLLAKRPSERPSSAVQVRALLASLRDLSARPILASTAEPAARTLASAAVVTPTRTLPALDPPAEPPPAQAGARFIPVAMAITVAAVFALAVAVYAAGRADHTVTQPNAASSFTPAPVAAQPPTSPSNATVQTVRAAIQAQLQAGQVDAADANDLAGRLDDVNTNLNRGRTSEAAEKLSDLRSRLSQLRADGKITDAGFVAIVIAINRLAATIPTEQGGDGHH